ncbi:protein phosphatase 2C 51-like [Humulus lupulus]|uniref:protein phosphatase 2C 51-like n=1 Tax=Humulus lupulus TaxID=3486 RepID=UPI002B413074|nr:protein phosphatase 2C 51-like [Humulus lupulus]
MRKKLKPLSPPAKDLRGMTLNSVELSIVKSKRANRKRVLKLQSLKYTCQTKIDDSGDEKQFHRQDPLKITVSLSSSSSSGGNDGVVLSRETREGKHYGVVSVIGRRSEMEDAVRAELGFAVKGSKTFDFFGVYDGHGGAHVAEMCRERLHEVVASELVRLENNDDGGSEWEKVLEGCFDKMDEEVRGNAAARTVGSTAVVAVVAEEEVVVANCGDCRAVMSRAGVALALSTDHKPNIPDELERIEDAGGRVINWNGYRVLGVLATSRSIGDEYLRPFVISKPEVTVTKRTNNDEFLILASDGLWDVVSNEAACKVVKKCFDGEIKRLSNKEVLNGSRATAAAAVLADLAMARGSRDNISVIVVDLAKT